MPSARGSSLPRDWTHVSHNAGEFFTLSHQGSPWVRSLDQEDPTCNRATKSLRHDWACALEPGSHNYWSLCAQGQWAETTEPACCKCWSLSIDSLCSPTGQATAVRSPRSPQPEKARTQQRRPSSTKKPKTPQPPPSLYERPSAPCDLALAGLCTHICKQAALPPWLQPHRHPWSLAQAREASTCLRPLALAAPSTRHTFPTGVCVSQGPSSSGCRSNVPACPQRNSSPICPLQHRGEATSVGCSGRAGRHQAGEEGMWSRAYRQRACGGKQIEAGMPRAKGRTWAPGCRGDSPQSMRCVGTAPGPCQHRGAAASKHTLPALGVPAKCMLTAEPPDNLPQGQELAAPTPSPPGSLIPLRSTDEQRGQMADCTGSLEVLGGCCLGDAVTVGQGGRAGLRLRWRRTTGPSRHTSQGDHRPHFMGLSGAEPRML